MNHIVTMKLIVDDEIQALLLLSFLPNKLEMLVVSFNNSAPNGMLQLAMVKDSLFNGETKKKDMGKDNAYALAMENRGRSRSRNSKRHGKFRSHPKSKGKFKCFYYNKECHVRRNCKAWKNT